MRALAFPRGQRRIKPPNSTVALEIQFQTLDLESVPPRRAAEFTCARQSAERTVSPTRDRATHILERAVSVTPQIV